MIKPSQQSQKIRVVFALPSFLFGGGIEKHLLKMFPLFDRDRFDLSLLTLFEYPGRPNMYADVPSYVHIERLAFKGPFDIGSWVRLFAVLRHMRPDVVISSMFSASTPIRVLKPFLGYKVIVREHNTYTDKRLHHRVIDHLLSYCTDAITAVSVSVGDFISQQARIAREKIVVIHNGVDFDDIQQYQQQSEKDIAHIRSEIGVPSNQKIVLNVSRLKPQKNHELLIRSFAEFHHVHPDYVLVIAGEGSERQRLEQLLDQLHLAEVVFLVGHRTDVYAFFAAADSFVLTSRHEGFPNVGIEAMAFGLPFVSTLVPGVDEFLKDGENGFLIESQVKSVVAVMNRVSMLSPEERLQLSKAAKATARRFDMKDIVGKYQNLIETVCRS